MGTGTTSTDAGLFRLEALQAKQDAWLGDIHLATPPRRWLVVSVALALTASILAFLFFGHYTRRATVPGTLVPTSGLLNVTALHGGVVRAIDVHLGDVVQRGAPLLEIDSDLDSKALGSTDAVVSAQLDAQRLKLEADLTDQAGLLEDQTDALRTRVAALRSQRTQVTGQIALEQQSVQSLDTLLHKIEPLGAKGYVSALEIQQQKLADLNAQAQLKALTGQQVALTQQIADAEQQLAQLPLQAATQRHATQNQLAQIATALAQNEAARALVLHSPESGVVSSLVVKTGQSVATGQALMSVVPQGARLEAQLLVPSPSVGFMHRGERVLLRYQAFPYQKFGLHAGRVIQVSRSALGPADAAALLGQPTKQPFYRVLVALDHQQVDAYGRRELLRPGMTFTADVLLERRRLIDWIFEPLLGMKRRLDAEGKP